MTALVLKLDCAGRPVTWVTREDGALLYCRDQVLWEAGRDVLTLRGGTCSATGERSVLAVSTIVATRHAAGDRFEGVPLLTNARLFRRDRHTCLYCGTALPARALTRDHVVPVSRGGRDAWENVVTACRACNQRKADRTLEELGMELLAVPFVPNRAEGLILANRRILVDQMDYLQAQAGRHSRLARA